MKSAVDNHTNHSCLAAFGESDSFKLFSPILGSSVECRLMLHVVYCVLGDRWKDRELFY